MPVSPSRSSRRWARPSTWSATTTSRDSPTRSSTTRCRTPDTGWSRCRPTGRRRTPATPRSGCGGADCRSRVSTASPRSSTRASTTPGPRSGTARRFSRPLARPVTRASRVSSSCRVLRARGTTDWTRPRSTAWYNRRATTMSASPRWTSTAPRAIRGTSCPSSRIPPTSDRVTPSAPMPATIRTTSTRSSWATTGPSWLRSTTRGAICRCGGATTSGSGFAHHDLTSQQYQALFDQYALWGYIPFSVQGSGSGANARFAAVFAATDQPLTPQLTTRGRQVPDLQVFDDYVTSWMASNDARGATLAIVKDCRLVLARAYTLAPSGYPITDPLSYFRIASCSKPLTSIAVHQHYAAPTGRRCSSRTSPMLDLLSRRSKVARACGPS